TRSTARGAPRPGTTSCTADVDGNVPATATTVTSTGSAPRGPADVNQTRADGSSMPEASGASLSSNAGPSQPSRYPVWSTHGSSPRQPPRAVASRPARPTGDHSHRLMAPPDPAARSPP